VKIFITGISGFIGTNLALFLNARDHSVYGMDINPSGLRGKLLRSEGIDVSVGDVTVAAAFRRCVRDADVVIHLAAETDALSSFLNSRKMAMVNVLGTDNVLKVASEVGAKKFVFASSGAVYGGSPHEESSPCFPENPYGASKVAGEALVSAYANRKKDMDYYCLRIGNVYGPYCTDKTSVVATFMKAILREHHAIVVHGEGKQTRDFIFVGDLCKMVDACLAGGGHSGVYNIASGHSYTVLDLLSTLRKVVSGDTNGFPEVRFAERANCGPMNVRFRMSKTVRHLLPNYEPITLLEGLDATWAWLRSKQDGGEERV
jgi:UDP-glucose 4-epimerase